MPHSLLAERLRAGRPSLGTWRLVPDPTLTEVAGRAGLHFQVLDMEHGFFDLVTLEGCIRAADATGCSPLVRVPGLDRALVQSCLDLGAHGVVVPQVRGVQDAADVVAATRHPPGGTRGFNPFTRSSGYGDGGSPVEPLVVVIVENRDAYDELDEIAALPGVDVVYLGVYDMSVELGVPGDVAAPAVQEFFHDSVRRVLAAGKAVGAMARTPEGLPDLVRLGVQVLVHGVDTDVYRASVAKGVDALALLDPDDTAGGAP